MDLRRLRYFTVLAETLNFHRAAERLNISQPPLTVAIRKLEEELGARLFERGGRGVRLTAAGRAAIAPAREALAQAELVRDAVRQGATGERGELRVGFVGSAVVGLLPGIIPTFQHRYPHTELHLDEMKSADIASAIERRELDIGLVRLPLLKHAALEMHVIEHDILVAAVPAGHPLAKRRSIRLAELGDQPFIVHDPISVLHMITMLACQEAGFAPVVTQDAAQVQTILALVQSGLGVALAPAKMTRFAPDGVRLLPLQKPIGIETGIVCRADAGLLERNFMRVALEWSDIYSVSNTTE